ncbi:MAG: hypothetical protein ACMVY4_07090 [Minwuia sp.]|uniref:hypothetical protein n=1 Tax=Minwuia sp. TaxID=2493630 RepID=UPI003A85C656
MKDGDDRTSNSDISSEAQGAERPSFFDGPLPDAHLFDPADYRGELGPGDGPADKVAAILEYVWRSMSIMVDNSIGVSSIHNLLPELFGNPEDLAAIELDSKLDRVIAAFKRAAVNDDHPAGKGDGDE